MKRDPLSKRLPKRRLTLGFACALGASLVFSCAAKTKDAGGLMLAIDVDDALSLDGLDLTVESGGKLLKNQHYRVPDEASLPTSIAIASNGDPHATVQITVVGWNNDLPLDRRDAIVTQVPTDRVALLRLVLSGECSGKVKLVEGEAVSTCKSEQTCDPDSGDCVGTEIDALQLPAFKTGDDEAAGRGGNGTGGSATGTGNAGATSMEGGQGAEGPVAGKGSTGGTGSLGGKGNTAGVDAGTAGSAVGTSGSVGSGGEAGTGPVTLDKFSFFVTSMEAMIRLSKSADGFGGDLRYGTGDGLKGADKICTEIAETSMPGSSVKEWHAFLSTAAGPVHAKDRIGSGPWYDRIGRLVAQDLASLIAERPGADIAIKADLPNEYGIPNHRPNPNMPEDDNHHILTGSDAAGMLFTASARATCADWTSSSRDNTTTGNGVGRPRIGFSWSTANRIHWISGQTEGGCGAGITGVGTVNGGSDPSNPIVGSGGGYGGIYCFALTP